MRIDNPRGIDGSVLQGMEKVRLRKVLYRDEVSDSGLFE